MREVDTNYQSSINTKIDANRIVREADKIIGTPAPVSPTPAQSKAILAKDKAGEAIGFADQAITSWEAYLGSPAQVRARGLKLNTGKANASLAEAQSLFAEVQSLLGGTTEKTIDEIVREVEQSRKDVGLANTTVIETFERIKTLDTERSTPQTEAARTVVSDLVTQTATRFADAVAAENAAKATGADRATVTRAATDAGTAKREAEGAALRAEHQESVARASVVIAVDPPKTSAVRTKELATSNSGAIGIGAFVLLGVLIWGFWVLHSRIPDFNKSQQALVLGLVVIAAVFTYSAFRNKKPTDRFWAGVVALAVVFFAIMLLVDPNGSIDTDDGDQQKTEVVQTQAPVVLSPPEDKTIGTPEQELRDPNP